MEGKGGMGKAEILKSCLVEGLRAFWSWETRGLQYISLQTYHPEKLTVTTGTPIRLSNFLQSSL